MIAFLRVWVRSPAKRMHTCMLVFSDREEHAKPSLDVADESSQDATEAQHLGSCQTISTARLSNPP